MSLLFDPDDGDACKHVHPLLEKKKLPGRKFLFQGGRRQICMELWMHIPFFLLLMDGDPVSFFTDAWDGPEMLKKDIWKFRVRSGLFTAEIWKSPLQENKWSISKHLVGEFLALAEKGNIHKLYDVSNFLVSGCQKVLNPDIAKGRECIPNYPRSKATSGFFPKHRITYKRFFIVPQEGNTLLLRTQFPPPWFSISLARPSPASTNNLQSL